MGIRMISEQARKSLDGIFIRAVQSRLALHAGDTCEVRAISDGASHAPDGQSMVVLTISSLHFRLLMMFHFDESPQALAYFAGDAEGKPFREIFYETANLCCGAVNQELLKHFPDLGMSTPFTLDSRCALFLRELNPGFTARYAIVINDSLRLSATLCLCDYASMDFSWDGSAVEDVSGELELF
ncbi:hypothetical protein [Noviherbaspirillum aerium]|uniref:hypothetical protein n=1 Tax=Noviherbaspirillum aerium TaxID=2588497 RepID=UPI001CEF8306|nr:hypothetical protein [Noviherbaspirillum aerium]